MIKFAQQGSVGIVSLNRPEKRNALHPTMVKQLMTRLSELENEVSVKVVVITGEGSSFCAGADLEYLGNLRKYSLIENENDSSLLADFFQQIYFFPKPTIACVNGPAIAGGCGLATVCDFIFAHPVNSKFGFSEVKIGFIPAIVSIFLIKKIGEGKATEMLLSGDVYDGTKAFNIGLVSYLSEETLNDSIEFGLKLSANSSQSMYETKKMIKSISNMNVREAVDYCKRLNVISRNTNEFKKGIEKYFEKNQREK
ncbi:MAG: enoyl-CoA hydratase/isomerase family protein [Ignavibacteriales bacterium]|nr:MAG: enoyl-CoA hydratase/isomerase family protein [Ignavibacteriales bacterium]